MNFELAGAPWAFFVLAMVILFAPIAAERAHLPGILGLLIGGWLVGSNGLGLLQYEAIAAIGELGLLYLMFLAGLELDLDEFARNRNVSLGFGALTFTFPLVLGMIGGFALGFEAAAAILMGSIWASHTLVAYPTVQEHGLVTNRAVAATVGGTVLTDTAALLILAVVSGSTTGSSGPWLVVQIAAGLAGLVVYCFLLLPRITRWFYGGFGQQPVLRFLFTLAALMSAAYLADSLGLEGIVGAFFAGLALNRLVPKRGRLIERIQFFGEALFVPAFLVSTGMIIDPAAFLRAETLRMAAIFAVAVVVGKLVAALLTGRLFTYTRAEVGLVFSLSVAQAAATLAATTVGAAIGLFDAAVVNAVLMVIVVTLLISSFGARRYAQRVEPAVSGAPKLGYAVITGATDPLAATALARLGARLALADGGVVLPVAVVTTAGENAEPARAQLHAAERAAAELGAEVETSLRVDDTLLSGMLGALVERQGSLLVTSWLRTARLRSALFGPAAAAGLPDVPAPVLVVAPATDPEQRIVVPVGGHPRGAAVGPDLDVCLGVARRLQAGEGLPVVVLTRYPDAATPLLSGFEAATVELATGSVRDMIKAHAAAGDLVMVPGPLTRTLYSRDALRPGELPAGTALVLVAGAHRAGLAGAGRGARVAVALR